MAERPLPVRDDVNRQYWDGAQEGKLVLQRCPECNLFVHPPRRMCPRCRSEDLQAAEVSGTGSVYSWSVMQSGGNPGFEDRLPYIVLVVELAEQSGLLAIGNLLDGRTPDLTIGTPVEVCFERINDEVTLPQWRLVEEAARR